MRAAERTYPWLLSSRLRSVGKTLSTSLTSNRSQFAATGLFETAHTSTFIITLPEGYTSQVDLKSFKSSNCMVEQRPDSSIVSDEAAWQSAQNKSNDGRQKIRDLDFDHGIRLGNNTISWPYKLDECV